MITQAFKTHIIEVGENLFDVLDEYLPCLEEKDIVVITSKIMSVSERRVVHKNACSKQELVQQEADAWIEGDFPNSYNMSLTIKNGVLIPSAGIDESNCPEGYILYPKDVQTSAKNIWDHLRSFHKIKELGVLITDSHTTPLRRGVTGIALGWCGFEPLYNYIGQKDLFGRPLQVTMSNALDALSAAAVFVMGEGAEATPIGRIQKAPKITFVDRSPTQEEEALIKIPIEEDIYFPLLSSVHWKRSRS